MVKQPKKCPLSPISQRYRLVYTIVTYLFQTVSYCIGSNTITFIGAEDIIIQEVSPMSLLATLEWSSKSHGSHWVYRQTMHYFREEFLNIIHLDGFLNLPKQFVIEALKSDFLQVCVIVKIPIVSI